MDKKIVVKFFNFKLQDLKKNARQESSLLRYSKMFSEREVLNYSLLPKQFLGCLLNEFTLTVF